MIVSPKLKKIFDATDPPAKKAFFGGGSVGLEAKDLGMSRAGDKLIISQLSQTLFVTLIFSLSLLNQSYRSSIVWP